MWGVFVDVDGHKRGQTSRFFVGNEIQQIVTLKRTCIFSALDFMCQVKNIKLLRQQTVCSRCFGELFVCLLCTKIYNVVRDDL